MTGWTRKTRAARNWCCTGDQFRRDAEGYYWYEGRADDMLKVSGIWVSPLEVENCLLAHAAVKEVCVVGWKDEAGLVTAKAYVVVKDGVERGEALKGELIEHAKVKLARYKAPRWVEWLDALPRNDRGKIERKKWRSASCKLVTCSRCGIWRHRAWTSARSDPFFRESELFLIPTRSLSFRQCPSEATA